MTVTPELNNRPNKDGLHTIQIRITHNRKLKRIALEYAIPLADWNPEKKEVRKSNPLHLPKNEGAGSATGSLAQPNSG